MSTGQIILMSITFFGIQLSIFEIIIFNEKKWYIATLVIWSISLIIQLATALHI